LFYRVVINSVSSRESTCNIAACIATSSPSSAGYYVPPLSTPLIPRRRHERSTAPPLPPSSMPSVFLDIKGLLSHNHSNLGPLTPQSDALTTRPLRPGTKSQRATVQCSGTLRFCRVETNQTNMTDCDIVASTP